MVCSLRVAISLLLSLFAACHSTPPRRLTVRDAYPADYEGWLRVLADEDAAMFGDEPAAEAGDGANVTFRVTVVELPVADAVALVPELMLPATLMRRNTASTPIPSDSTADTGDERDAEARRSRGNGVASGTVDTGALRGTLAGMRHGPYPFWTAHGVTRVGGAAVLADTNQTAFVKSIRYATRPVARTVDDIEVASFSSGNRLRLAAAPRDDGLQLDIDWLERTPVRPIPLARGRSGALQVPVFEHHRVTTSVPIARHDALVVASLPGQEQYTVQLLCVEIDAREKSVVATR